jgi:hypothetical protein
METLVKWEHCLRVFCVSHREWDHDIKRKNKQGIYWQENPLKSTHGNKQGIYWQENPLKSTHGNKQGIYWQENPLKSTHGNKHKGILTPNKKARE